MQKLENLKTMRRRQSQLEVKLVTEKLKNEGTGSIRLNLASLRSFFLSFQEFKIIRKLPSDIVSGYLTLRKANIQLQ